MFRLDGRAGTKPAGGSTSSDVPAVGDTHVSCRLTTAETLVLGVVAAHRLRGADHTTLSRDLWVKPQLESLSVRELLSWTFDDDANFRVVATDRLMLVAPTVGVTAAFDSASPPSIVEPSGRTTATQGASA